MSLKDVFGKLGIAKFRSTSNQSSSSANSNSKINIAKKDSNSNKNGKETHAHSHVIKEKLQYKQISEHNMIQNTQKCESQQKQKQSQKQLQNISLKNTNINNNYISSEVYARNKQQQYQHRRMVGAQKKAHKSRYHPSTHETQIKSSSLTNMFTKNNNHEIREISRKQHTHQNSNRRQHRSQKSSNHTSNKKFVCFFYLFICPFACSF